MSLKNWKEGGEKKSKQYKNNKEGKNGMMETNEERLGAVIEGGEEKEWTITGWRKVRMERKVGKNIAKNGE